MVSNGHSDIHTSPRECERWQGDIAVFVIGALEGVERDRLLTHLDGCPRCESLREELAETALALGAVVPVRPTRAGTSLTSDHRSKPLIR